MPREFITTTYTELEFKELLSGLISEAVKEEIDRLQKRPIRQYSEKEFLTRQETAGILGISLPTLHNRVKEGFITPRRVGSSVRFKWEDIDKAMRTYEERNPNSRRLR